MELYRVGVDTLHRHRIGVCAGNRVILAVEFCTVFNVRRSSILVGSLSIELDAVLVAVNLDSHISRRWPRAALDNSGLVGSAQEFDEACILSRFLKNDKFCFCDRHALRLEQQVGEIFVATTPSKKGFDVAVDGFHDPETYFGAAVIQDSVQVIR